MLHGNSLLDHSTFQGMPLHSPHSVQVVIHMCIIPEYEVQALLGSAICCELSLLAVSWPLLAIRSRPSSS